MLARFCHDREGSIAVTFAMMLIPMVAVTALAVDISQAYLVRSRLAHAIDAAGLAMASSTGTDAELKARLDAFLIANYPDNALGMKTSVNTMTIGEKTEVTATASVDTTFGRVVGINKIDVSVSNEIVREVTGLEVALVLDNTGSMKDGTKMADLKRAAKSLVDKLAATAQRSSTPDAVRLALIPYTMTVNVGSYTYNNAPSWIDKNGVSPINNEIFSSSTPVRRLNLFANMGVAWGGCVEARPSPYDVTEAPPTTATPATLYVPYFAPDEPDWSGEGFVNNYVPDESTSSNWKTRQGYLSKYDQRPKTGTTSLGYQFGPNSGCEIKPLTRLTANFTSFKAAIDAMVAGGDTNISAGLMWGWHTLSPNAPFADGKSYTDPKFTKVIILMTDGQNHNVVLNNDNRSAYSGIGYIWQNRIGMTSGTSSQRISRLDQKLNQACNNAKQAGIVIYTVVLKDSAVDQSTVKACASSPGKMFDVTDSAQFQNVFDTIAGSIQNLRLSK